MSVNGTSHETDIDLDTLYAFWPNIPAPVPCPEASFSLSLQGHVQGHPATLTVRGQTIAAFRAHVAEAQGLLDAVAPRSPGGETEPAVALPPCPAGHGFMRKGKHGLYCPKKLPDGTYCPQKG
jgi:hypothetical protein